MATAVTSIDTNEVAVRQLLHSLFSSPGGPSTVDLASQAAGGAQAAAATAAADALAASKPLQLHPRVDAAHPLGTARSAQELEAALKLYSQLATSLSLEVDDVLLAPDKALATGHLVVTSHLSRLAAAGAPSLSAATSALPGPLRSLTDTLLPAGLKPGRVPITIQMRLGKNDAGDAVVTHMSLVFSLLSTLLPHVELNQHQQQLAAQSQPALLSLLQQLGSASAVAEDTLTSVGASWRAGSAVLQATVGQVLSAATQQAQHLWSRRSGDSAAAQ